MRELAEVVLGYPTAIFTTLLLITVGWWLISLVFGLGEGDLDFDIDGDAAGDAGGDGGGEAGDSNGGSFLANLLTALNLHVIPLTLALSIISVVGWGVSSIATLLIVDSGGSLALITGLVVIFVALAAGVVAAGQIGKLLAPLFVPAIPVRRRDLVGRVCIVRTGRVDAEFGQAEVVDADKGSHIVQVRCNDSTSLAAGSRALIVDVDAEGVFIVSADVAGLV